MYVTNITEDYDNITSSKYRNYEKISSANCTNNENNIDKTIPASLFTIPCGLTFLCLIHFIVYTIIKPLFNSTRIWRTIYVQFIHLDVLQRDQVT